MTQLIITKDVNGVATYGIPFNGKDNNGTDTSFKMKLSANTPKNVVAPSINGEPMLAIFSYEPGSKVWVAQNPETSISPPSGDPEATPAQLNPPSRNVFMGDTLQFVTSDTSAEACVSFYTIPKQSASR